MSAVAAGSPRLRALGKGGFRFRGQTRRPAVEKIFAGEGINAAAILS